VKEILNTNKSIDGGRENIFIQKRGSVRMVSMFEIVLIGELTGYGHCY
jgi:hypothetical protein